MLASVWTSFRRRAAFSLARSGATIAKRLGFTFLRRGRRREAALCFACEHRIVRTYLDRFFAGHSAQLSRAGEERPLPPAEARRNAWTLWWQGAEAAPPLVSTCISSARRNLSRFEVIVLDEESAQSLLELPSWLLDRMRSGEMTVTMLSDLIRVKLLRSHGGIWIDATLLFLPGATLPEGADGFITRRRSSTETVTNTFVSEGRWSSFLLGGPAGLPLWALMDTAFELYWRAHSRMIDYHLVDYLIDYIYRHDLGGSRRLIDSVPPSHARMHELATALAEKRDVAEGIGLDQATRVYKLTTRSPIDVQRIRALVEGGSVDG